MDADGYFPQSRTDVYQNTNPLAVAAEARTQVMQAFPAGVDVSHIDSHMGTVLNSKFIESYLNVAKERSLSAMLPRMAAIGFEMFNFDTQALKKYEQILERVELRAICPDWQSRVENYRAFLNAIRYKW